MSSRFEQIITGAVVTGAIAIAGCASSGGGDPASEPEEKEPSDVQFWGARSISDDSIRLYFSDTVQMPEDSGDVAGLFVLRGVSYAPAVELVSAQFCTTTFGTFQVSGSITFLSYYCDGSDTFATDMVADNAAQSGDEIGAISAVEVDPDDDTRVILTVNVSLEAAAEGTDAGLLRLTYTGGEGGLLDAGGAEIQDIAVDEDALGNVGADIGGAPVLIRAAMLDDQTVELVFNEPVSVPSGDEEDAAGDFSLGVSCGSGWSLESVYSGVEGQATPWDDPVVASFSTDAYFKSSSLQALSDWEQSAALPQRIVLARPSPISADDDAHGYLRLRYVVGESSPIIEGAEGTELDSFSPSPLSPGNVRDSGDSSKTDACPE